MPLTGIMSTLNAGKPVRWVCKACRTSTRTPTERTPRRWQSNTASAAPASKRQWSTPLARTVGEAIQTTGPISIAQYMRQCLTSPDGGYYTRQAENGDQFGQKGDFITSPEISQVFGELLGLWFLTEWMAQGRKRNGTELIEVGPGRGTLMDDMLRALRNFKAFTSSIESVYMIEASPSLRNKQKQLLCGSDALMEEVDIGWRSRSKYDGIPITWCEDIRHLPKSPDRTPFIVAHEFFDALPIHAFRTVAPAPGKPQTVLGLDGKPIELAGSKSSVPKSAQVHQWRELLVTLAPPPNEQTKVHKPHVNVSSETPPDFQLTQAPASTPSSLVMPEISSRYKTLKSTTDAVIEISPESQSYAGEFATRIGGGNLLESRSSQASLAPPAPLKPSPAGAALILDYGPSDTVPRNTLRGIRAHELVSPFTYAGLVDLSADVDFVALADAALDASPGVEVHGPVEQGQFLETMGIRERAAALAKKAQRAGRSGSQDASANAGVDASDKGDKDKVGDGDSNGDQAAKRILDAVERLVERGGGGMGRIYKAMAIVPENGGRRRPVGFGGQVVQQQQQQQQ